MKDANDRNSIDKLKEIDRLKASIDDLNRMVDSLKNNSSDQIKDMEQRDHLIASIPCAWSEPHWYLLGPVAIRYSGNQIHCSRTPHVPFSVRQIFPKLSMFLRKYSGMMVRCQGLLFAVPRCESHWTVCAVPCVGWVCMMRVVLLSAAVVLILTGAIPTVRPRLADFPCILLGS